MFFGSLCFAFILDNDKTKFKLKVRKCVFLKYKTRIKGTLFWILTIGKYSLTKLLLFMRKFFHTKHLMIIRMTMKNKFEILLIFHNTIYFIE